MATNIGQLLQQGLLTGVGSTQQPVQQAVPGSPNFYGEFMAARGRGLQQGLGRLARGGEPSTQEQIQGAMFQLSSPTTDGVAKDTATRIADLTKLARVQQVQGNTAAAAQTAAQVQQLREQALKTEQAKKLALQVQSINPALAKQIVSQVPGSMEAGLEALQPKGERVNIVRGSDRRVIATAIEKPDGSLVSQSTGQPITLSPGLGVSKTIPGAGTTIQTGKSAEALRAELEGEMTLQQFRDQSKDLVARGKLTKESYGKFMPVLETLEQLEASGAVGEGGAGAAFFADAANAMTTAMQIIDPNFKAPVGATSKIQYESIAKMLKAKMTEMTKGAISDRENAEHNKYTTSINMPKAVRQSKINIDKATLESSMNKQSAEEQWFEKYRTTTGFNAAWKRYTEDFPRTAGAALRNVTVDGKTKKKLVDNFEMVEDNMRLFDRLYLGKKTSGSPVFTDGEKRLSLQQVKDELYQKN